MAEKRKLGRGLSSLLGERPDAPVSPEISRMAKPVPIEFLHPGKYQPRHYMDQDAIEALAQSIRDKGVLQPLLVRRHPNDPNAYEIIAGERRWRAAQLAKLHEVPVIIKNFDDKDTLEVALIENVQREDLSAIEEADAYQRLIDEFSHTQEDVAKLVGKSRSHIANTLRLLNLDDAVKRLVEIGQLSAGHARTLIGLDNAERLALKIISNGLSVRQAEKLTSAAAKPQGAKSSAASTKKDVDTLALERDVSNLLGMNVQIHAKGKGGTLAIEYSNLDQLDDLLSKLTEPQGRSRTSAEKPTSAGRSSALKSAPPESDQEKPKLSVSLKPKKR